MKTKSSMMIVAASVLVLVVTGCETAQQTADGAGPRVATNDPHGYCHWTVQHGTGSHAGQALPLAQGGITNVTSLKPNANCRPYESTQGTPLYIVESGSQKRILQAVSGEFETEGSCRYCYFNTVGGITCVSYNC